MWAEAGRTSVRVEDRVVGILKVDRLEEARISKHNWPRAQPMINRWTTRPLGRRLGRVFDEVQRINRRVRDRRSQTRVSERSRCLISRVLECSLGTPTGHPEGAVGPG